MIVLVLLKEECFNYHLNNTNIDDADLRHEQYQAFIEGEKLSPSIYKLTAVIVAVNLLDHPDKLTLVII